MTGLGCHRLRPAGPGLTAAGVVLALALLSGCGVASGATSPTPTTAVVPTPPTLTPRRGFELSDPAQPITARVGGRFTITLREFPSMGFRFVAVQTPDSAVARQVDHESFGEAPGLAGSPTIRIWTYLATGPGTTTITWQMARPNNVPNPRGTDIERPYAFTVQVGP